MYVYRKRKRERKGLKGKLIQGKMQKYNIDRENNSKRVEIKIHASFFRELHDIHNDFKGFCM